MILRVCGQNGRCEWSTWYGKYTSAMPGTNGKERWKGLVINNLMIVWMWSTSMVLTRMYSFGSKEECNG